ncbi:hypothetical protein PVAND_017390 [Polypedilum vanderplanki]|uniref:Gamma interferon inducible lysosomal thiol reductase n=1 Tax=Polypedilum vanderplanki TaxID=319348 RepID=A0A9J6BIW7_POLVA|nr:hypothetical protein PVAND_017390 [Polypedilum vanderplanki]
MFLKFSLIFFLTFLKISEGILKVDIFLESECKSSKQFLQEQIKPNYEQIKGDVLLTFVPFGKSHSITNTSGIFFECQHGHFECHNNIFLSCALNLITESDLRTQFMICAMDYSTPLNHCASEVGLKIREVHECAESNDGIELQLENEKKTTPIIEMSGHVPTIVFNEIYDKNDDEKAFMNFLEIVKEKI